MEPKGWVLYTHNDDVPTGIHTSARVAPGGAANGWQIRVSDNFPIGGGASRFALERLFPGVTPSFHDTHRAPVHGIDLPPWQVHLTYPNACTALVTYRINALVVKGVVHLEPRSLLRGEFVAMPEVDAKIQAFLLKSFMAKPLPQIHRCAVQTP